MAIPASPNRLRVGNQNPVPNKENCVTPTKNSPAGEPSTPQAVPNSEQKPTPIRAAALAMVNLGGKLHTPLSPITNRLLSDANARVLDPSLKSPGRRFTTLVGAYRDLAAQKTSGPTAHETAVDNLRKSPWMGQKYQGLLSAKSVLGLTHEQNRDLEYGSFIDIKHIGEGEVNPSGRATGKHWIDALDTHKGHIQANTIVLNSETGVAIAKYLPPTARSAKTSTFYPCTATGASKPILTKGALTKLVEGKTIELWKKSDKKFLAHVLWGKKIWLIGIKDTDGDTNRTIYPVYAMHELPESHQTLVLIAKGDVTSRKSYEFIKTRKEIKTIIKDSIRSYEDARYLASIRNKLFNQASPVLFLDKEYAWVDIAPYLKNCNQAGPNAFPVSSGIIIKVKRSSITESVRCDNHIKRIQADHY